MPWIIYSSPSQIGCFAKAELRDLLRLVATIFFGRFVQTTCTRVEQRNGSTNVRDLSRARPVRRLETGRKDKLHRSAAKNTNSARSDREEDSSTSAPHAEPRINFAPFSAIIIVGTLVFPLGICGISDASMTRRLLTPRTLRSQSNTASSSATIRHVPTG